MEPQASSWLGELWCWLEAHAEVLRNLAFALSLSLAATLGTVLLVIRTVAINRSSKAALKQSESAMKQSEAALKQSEAALKQSEVALKQSEISEQSHITERFSKAVELLGHKDVAVRLGAIYALERIARDSRRDHWAIMETLMAYTRKERENVLDVQAILVVISRRYRFNDPESVVIDLSKSNLHSVSAQRLELPGAVMIGADLQGADLQGADLQGADLQGANLQGANLQGANLQGANLEGAKLQEANLEGAELQEANLQGADLKGANLEGAKLQRAKLQGANLQEADLKGADLKGADLKGADLKGADLHLAKLQGADLRVAKNLGCESLRLASSWEFALRDPELTCGVELLSARESSE